MIAAYIHNQEAHHARTDFRTAYRAILEAEGLDFDETRLFETVTRGFRPRAKASRPSGAEGTRGQF